MYTYIYMYIYIYRILLNKFVLYTMAIYTTVLSLDGNSRPHIFAHFFFQLYTEKERDREREEGEGGGRMRKEKETVPPRE